MSMAVAHELFAGWGARAVCRQLDPHFLTVKMHDTKKTIENNAYVVENCKRN